MNKDSLPPLGPLPETTFQAYYFHDGWRADFRSQDGRAPESNVYLYTAEKVLAYAIEYGELVSEAWRLKLEEQARRIYDGATHAAAMAVFMTRMDAEAPEADDLGVSGWLQEAEQRVRNRTTHTLGEILSTGAIAAHERVQGVPEDLKERLTDAIAEGLRGTYYCNRVWEAWHVGTMSQNDFYPADESDIPAELADSVIAMLSAKPEPAAPKAPQAEPVLRYTDGFLCQAWGETDLPSAEIVQNHEGIARFMVREWLGSADHTDDDGTVTLDSVMQEIKGHDFKGEGSWRVEFEIGGVSVDWVNGIVYGDAPQPAPTQAAGGEQATLTDDEIEDGAKYVLEVGSHLYAFEAGVRFAERHHGIRQPKDTQ